MLQAWRNIVLMDYSSMYCTTGLKEHVLCYWHLGACTTLLAWRSLYCTTGLEDPLLFYWPGGASTGQEEHVLYYWPE